MRSELWMNLESVIQHEVSQKEENRYRIQHVYWGFPGGSVLKNLPANAVNAGFIPWLRRSPGAENGNKLQYSCLRNPMDRET